ncbi:glycine-rich protein family [Trichomonas vaginalis G3]|uniref:glycine-rich protein family n=1 Tax=Trichomonas vaginalis (strain ATCC PRA-98 / G3) TaxID=412133 RepID=UPI0021E547AE|nr:glycine-rich protein family [Trichomonas vaginalis G3]KAI5509636.1 glycine-rich protein family [Trichomonas vaginalis G3]
MLRHSSQGTTNSSSTAAGGFARANKGGNGGYSVGYYVNNISTEAYFFLGGKGEDRPKFHKSNNNTPGGFNGGGFGGYDTHYGTYSGGGGGGSTDIRIGSDKIESRIIVAAGGGGACGYDNENEGGNAGGLHGSDGKSLRPEGRVGGGDTDQSGGIAYSYRGATSGSLFYGGNASTMLDAYGGGGGYFGGGGGSSTVDHYQGFCGSGGGGSGYTGGV